MTRGTTIGVILSMLLFILLLFAPVLSAQQAESDTSLEFLAYQSDRGEGIPTSMFGTYIRPGELIIYPFFEYYLDDNMEYKPAEFGYGLERDFRGRFRASEGILFVGYGINDWMVVEFEAAVIQAKLKKSQSDPSPMPTEIKASGLGDVEGQIRVRWLRESVGRPECFSYLEAVAPNQREKVLIGTPDWELKLGTGLIKGFAWGTMTVRAAIEYPLESSQFELGEYAVEYLKRISPRVRVYLGVEGSQDEASLIAEAQWHFSERLFLKLNNGIGITSKATDLAPEAGLVWIVPTR